MSLYHPPFCRPLLIAARHGLPLPPRPRYANGDIETANIKPDVDHVRYPDLVLDSHAMIHGMKTLVSKITTFDHFIACHLFSIKSAHKR